MGLRFGGGFFFVLTGVRAALRTHYRKEKRPLPMALFRVH